MIDKVTAFIEKYHMIEEGDLVAAGISGGADSLCLLFILIEYRKKVPFDLTAVHVNHCIREDSGEDAAFVKDICEKEKIPYFAWEQDVKAAAKERKISVEEAGRQIRYEAFHAALRKYRTKEEQKGKIAVAHHQGDCAETMLFNLFRGTGVYGMAGILPVRGNIIRPLLNCSREEIEIFLQKKNQTWCIDSTNEEDTYTRNRIRRHILPFAQEHINKGAIAHVAQAAMQMAQIREYLEDEVRKAAERCTKLDEREEKIEIDLPYFKKLPSFLQGQLLLWAVEQIHPGRRDITMEHIRALQELTLKDGSKKADLPGMLEAVKEYDVLWIQHKNQKSTAKEIQSRETILKIPGKYILENGDILEVSLIDRTKIEVIGENKYTKYLDYDKIINCPTIRFRQSGDYLVINDAGQKKTIKEYFIHEKIPAAQRGKISLIADGQHILWVIGHRISTYYKITDKTKHILQMTIWRE